MGRGILAVIGIMTIGGLTLAGAASEWKAPAGMVRSSRCR